MWATASSIRVKKYSIPAPANPFCGRTSVSPLKSSTIKTGLWRRSAGYVSKGETVMFFFTDDITLPKMPFRHMKRAGRGPSS